MPSAPVPAIGPTPAPSPLAQLLPDPDVLARHSRVVRACPEDVEVALRAFTLADMPIARVLFALRGLRGDMVGHDTEPLVAQMTSGGFHVLVDEPGHAFALGAIGQPWRWKGGMVPFSGGEEFAGCRTPGFAKMAMAFSLQPVADGTRVDEETRVVCTDAVSRRRFRLYWMPVRFGSGIVRAQMLSAIARRAESGRSRPAAR